MSVSVITVEPTNHVHITLLGTFAVKKCDSRLNILAFVDRKIILSSLSKDDCNLRVVLKNYIFVHETFLYY